MKETYPITLDVSKLDTLHTGYAFMQNDRKVHEMVFSVSGLEITAGSTVELRFLRPDNQVVAVESDALTVSSGKVHYGVQSNVLERAGVAHGILSVLSEDGRRSTGQFTFTVARDIDKDEAILGDDRLPIVQRLLEAMEESAILCEQSESNAKDYAEQAAESEKNASSYMGAAETAKVMAEKASANARGYAAGAKESAEAASLSEAGAAAKAAEAGESALQAEASAKDAEANAKAAAESAETAAESAKAADASAKAAETNAKAIEESAKEAEASADEAKAAVEEIKATPITPDMCSFMTEVHTPLDYENASGGVSALYTGTGANPQTFYIQGVSFSASAGKAYTLYFKATLKSMYAEGGVPEPTPAMLSITSLQAFDSDNNEIPAAKIKRIEEACFIAPEGVDHVMISSATVSSGLWQSVTVKLIEGNPYSYYVNEEANDAHIQALIDKSIEEAIVDSWEVGV